MRLSKFLSSVIFVTLFSLLYVHQQSEVFRFAYIGQRKQVIFQDLLDKNSILRYNVDRNSSLVQLGNNISGYADFHMPDTYQFVRLNSTQAIIGVDGRLAGKETLLSKIFGVKRQAQANTIYP